MAAWKIIRFVLICAALLVLFGSIALSIGLFWFNYQNIQLQKQAEDNFAQGDSESLALAETQLLQLVNDAPNNERAFILLAKIAQLTENYPKQVYYSWQAHNLNPLSEENEKAYIEALLYARDFERLENFLAPLKRKSAVDVERKGFLLYAAGQNGNIDKYRQLFESRDKNFVTELAFLLYKDTSLTPQERLVILEEQLVPLIQNDFHKQEYYAAKFSIFLVQNDFDQAEIALEEAYMLNRFAFAPALGRFYANYRSMGKALEIFEEYLALYHDPAVALQTAEIYCLLKKRDKISSLNKDYQSGSGKEVLLLNYYFEVLDRFAADDIASCQPYLAPLQEAINTPLATFIYFCSKLDAGDLAGIHKYYNALLGHRPYLDLQMRADQLIIELIKNAIASGNSDAPELLELAEKVYWRTPDATVGKLLLLSQRQKDSLNNLLLKDLMKRYPADQGVSKIAVEHYLSRDLAMAEEIIADYMKNYPRQQEDMLRYRIILAVRQQNFDQASQLFQENFSPEIAGEYWNFAMNGNRLDDLRFLSRDTQYKPFCEAAILLAEGQKDRALNILANADAGNNQTLLLYAAKTLAENDRIQEALALYNKFPEDSAFKLNVLLNSSELYWVQGDQNQAVRLAKEAYRIAPTLPEAQYCYADKLFKSGQFYEIADIIKFSASSPYSDQMRTFLTASLEFRLKNSDPEREKEKMLNTIDRLLRIDKNNAVALEYRKQIQTLQKRSD